MNFTAQQIAEILEGDIVGNPNAEVSKLSKIEEGEKGSLTFLSNPKYNPYLYTTKASITIVNKSFTPEKEIETTLIKVEDAYAAFSKVLEFYNEVKNNKTGREHPHFISSTALIGSNEYIGAFVVYKYGLCFCLYRRECYHWRKCKNLPKCVCRR